MDETEVRPAEQPDTGTERADELRALREELQAMRREWQGFLAGTAAAGVKGDRTPSPAGAAPEPTFTAAQIRGMTPQEINARWDDIRRCMGGRN